MSKLFKRWKRFDYVLFFGSVILVFPTIFIFNASVLSFLVFVTGIMAAMLNSKANRLCFLFYTTMVVLYAYTAFKSKFYGEAILNGLYLFPMYFVSAIKAVKDKSSAVTVEIFTITKKQLLVFGIIGVVLVPLYSWVLTLTGTRLPILNALGTFCCVVAGFLAAKKIREQWIVWIAYSVVLMAIWGSTLFESFDYFPTAVQNIVYLIIDIRGLVTWYRMQKRLSE